MLSLTDVRFSDDPYPHGLVANVFDPDMYTQLVAAFPHQLIDKFVEFSGGNRKRSLSEVNNQDAYHAFVKSHPLWSQFHQIIKSPKWRSHLIFTIMNASREGYNNLVDTYYRIRPYKESGYWLTSCLNHKANGFEPNPDGTSTMPNWQVNEHLTSRFEFSSLPAAGGCLRPHRDIPSKLVTLVIPMVRPDEWKQEWGGGTDLLTPASSNELRDYQAEFNEFNVSKTIPYAPNQAFIFLRSDKSWHSVGPIKGPQGKTRRTLTINIETA